MRTVNFVLDCNAIYRSKIPYQVNNLVAIHSEQVCPKSLILFFTLETLFDYPYLYLQTLEKTKNKSKTLLICHHCYTYACNCAAQQ